MFGIPVVYLIGGAIGLIGYFGFLFTKPFRWKDSQTKKYLGRFITANGIGYQVIDCIQEKGFVMAKDGKGYNVKIKISEITAIV